MAVSKSMRILRQTKFFFKSAYKFIPRWSRLIIGIAATITALSFLITGTISFYNDTVGEKNVAYQNILGLAAEAQIDYFNYSLGQPVFKNVKDGMNEYIYVNKYFYVQALCDSNDKVVLYSVTTRDKDFNPTFTRENGSYDSKTKKVIENDQKITLGKTTFAEASRIYGDSSGISLYVGARRYGYSESHYLGNPGNYQDFIFSLNDAGVNNGQYPPVKHINVGSFAIEAEEPKNQIDKFVSPFYDPQGVSNALSTSEMIDFRSKAAINTFTITSPNLEISLSKLPIGVEIDQVRVLHTLKSR